MYGLCSFYKVSHADGVNRSPDSGYVAEVKKRVEVRRESDKVGGWYTVKGREVGVIHVHGCSVGCAMGYFLCVNFAAEEPPEDGNEFEDDHTLKEVEESVVADGTKVYEDNLMQGVKEAAEPQDKVVQGGL